jgi:hypothetical protein
VFRQGIFEPSVDTCRSVRGPLVNALKIITNNQ